MTSKERVSQVYPDTKASSRPDYMWEVRTGGTTFHQRIGFGESESEAWDDAASKLPPESSPAGETASEGHRRTHDCILGCNSFDSEYADDPVALPEPVSTEGAAHIMRCPRCSIVDGVYCDEWRKLHPTTTVAAPIAPAAPVPKGTMPHRFESKIQGAICSHCDQPWFSSLHPEPAAKPSAEGDGWIAVTEKKPEVRDWVLAVDSSEGNVEVFLYVRRGFIRCPGGCTAYVTHWRPLPAPPSGQGEKR